MATTAMPSRSRYGARGRTRGPALDRTARSSISGTSLSSHALPELDGARIAVLDADLVAAMTPPGDARDGREVSASPAADSAAAAFVELVTWRRPARPRAWRSAGCTRNSASRRCAQRLPFGTVACYGFMFALAASASRRLASQCPRLAAGRVEQCRGAARTSLRTDSAERGRALDVRAQDRLVPGRRRSSGRSPPPRRARARRGDGVAHIGAHLRVGTPAHHA